MKRPVLLTFVLAIALMLCGCCMKHEYMKDLLTSKRYMEPSKTDIEKNMGDKNRGDLK